MTRNGKIARLPVGIREELNTRMEYGQDGAELLAWLNALPQAQASLKAGFDGLPISKQNLSEWRLGGFREWRIGRELLGQARHLSDGASEMAEALDMASLPGALAGMLACRYAAVLNAWDGEPDPALEAKLRLLRGLNQDIALLQKTMQQASRQQRELAQAAEEQERREGEEEDKRMLAPIMARVESEALSAMLGGGERGRRLADVIAATNHDLPPPKNQPKSKPPGQTRSKSIKPCPTESSPVKPSQTESNPVAPGPTESSPVASGQTASNPAEPDQTEANPVEPDPTQSNPVKPALSASDIMARTWERHKKDCVK